MIVTQKSLSRRTVLRGLGATVALPLLDAMVPALSAAGGPAGDRAGAPAGVLLRAERHAAAELPPRRRRRVRLRPHPGAASRSPATATT